MSAQLNWKQCPTNVARQHVVYPHLGRSERHIRALELRTPPMQMRHHGHAFLLSARNLWYPVSEARWSSTGCFVLYDVMKTASKLFGMPTIRITVSFDPCSFAPRLLSLSQNTSLAMYVKAVQAFNTARNLTWTRTMMALFLDFVRTLTFWHFCCLISRSLTRRPILATTDLSIGWTSATLKGMTLWSSLMMARSESFLSKSVTGLPELKELRKWRSCAYGWRAEAQIGCHVQRCSALTWPWRRSRKWRMWKNCVAICALCSSRNRVSVCGLWGLETVGSMSTEYPS